MLTQKQLENEQKVIELGQKWMSKSVDVGIHDYEHAKTVEQNALRIFEEYKAKGVKDVNDTDENLIRIVAWWHDAYKSRARKDTIASLFNEGEKSAVIFSRKAKQLMTPERFNLARYAIREHNKVWIHRFRLPKDPVLLRIILEADGVETVHSARLRLVVKKKKSLLKKLITRSINFGLKIYFLLYPLSQVAKQIMKQNIKT